MQHTEGHDLQPAPSRDRLDEERFRTLYLQGVDDVIQFWTPPMQDEIAKHCYPWRHGVTDFKEYLLASVTRYTTAYRSLRETGSFQSLCDVGGFFGVFPLTLARMGYSAAMTESFAYYSGSFAPLFRYLADNGVRVIDYDPFGVPPDFPAGFDIVSIMAVLEHYPHSLKRFMGNVLKLLGPGGRLYIEVPNIAYWPKRKAMLFGQSPLVPIEDIYCSETPFIGHHHEFTLRELEALADLNGLKVLKTNLFNYSFRGPLINRIWSDPLLFLMSFIPSMRECLAIVAAKA